MRTFVFRFAALLRYRRNRRDLTRQLLAQTLAAQRELVGRRAELEAVQHELQDELRAGGQQGPLDIDRLAARRYYAGRLAGELLGLERNEELVTHQLSLCRQALLEADRDVKVLEKLEERQQADFRYEQERREGRELEEAWQSTTYSR